jgi:hypothetical protein
LSDPQSSIWHIDAVEAGGVHVISYPHDAFVTHKAFAKNRMNFRSEDSGLRVLDTNPL